MYIANTLPKTNSNRREAYRPCISPFAWLGHFAGPLCTVGPPIVRGKKHCLAHRNLLAAKQGHFPPPQIDARSYGRAWRPKSRTHPRPPVLLSPGSTVGGLSFASRPSECYFALSLTSDSFCTPGMHGRLEMMPRATVHPTQAFCLCMARCIVGWSQSKQQTFPHKYRSPSISHTAFRGNDVITSEFHLFKDTASTFDHVCIHLSGLFSDACCKDGHRRQGNLTGGSTCNRAAMH